jgi:hypothetical protein
MKAGTRRAMREIGDRLVDEATAKMLEDEAATVVRDMATHVGDQIFELLKRNGMLLRTVASATGMTTLAAIQVLAQANDFAGRSMDDDTERAFMTTAIARLFLAELPDDLRSIIAKEARRR